MSFSIRVSHNGVEGLARDMEALPVKAATAFATTVKTDVFEGNQIARGFAKAGAGPHGRDYWKRVTAEMTGPYSGEYGPEGFPKSNFVGVGFRHGTNMDLPNSADIIGPKLAKDLRKDVDGLFW